MRAVDIRLFDSDSRTLIIFDMSEESIVTTVQPAYSILGVIEGLGGFAVVLFCLAKILVGGLTQRLYKSELLEKFYQVNQNGK